MVHIPPDQIPPAPKMPPPELIKRDQSLIRARELILHTEPFLLNVKSIKIDNTAGIELAANIASIEMLLKEAKEMLKVENVGK